ncbi:MAG: hypothetical protein WBF08_01250 [Candidatus Bathyarchaeia archaeon]
MKKRRTPYRVIQEHHITYTPNKTCLMFRSEHTIITKLNRLLKSKPSEAFLLELEKCHQNLRSTQSYSSKEMVHLKKNNQKIKKQRIRKKRSTVKISK